MSGDEVIVLLASLVVGPAMWVVWFYRLAGVEPLKRARSYTNAIVGVVIACGLILAAVLRTLAAPDVRDAPEYLFLYMTMGLAWLRVGEMFFAYAGVSVRDDVIERRNGAAVPAVAGALVGVTLCFAGGNVGAGPGWWVVVFSALLSTSALFLLWLVLARLAESSDAVTIDRDPAAGLRLGGLLVAAGLILGRAVAGDWHSVDATVLDFVRVGWVVIPLLTGALGVERAVRPPAGQLPPSVTTAGTLPAIIYVAVAAGYVVLLGRPA